MRSASEVVSAAQHARSVRARTIIGRPRPHSLCKSEVQEWASVDERLFGRAPTGFHNGVETSEVE